MVGDRRCINDTSKQRRFEELTNQIISALCKDEKEESLDRTEQKNIILDIVQESSFREATEYCRAVHAEMEAILSVCRSQNRSTYNSTMYVTT